MKHEPLISVVIPTYNRKGRIMEAINSVLDQGEKNMEIIVVDDGSTDGTSTYLRGLNLSIEIISQKNAGVSNARNTGIKFATGKYVAFLDSDDLWLPGKINAQLKFFQENPNISLVYTDQYIRIDGKNLDVTRFQRNKPNNRLALPAFVDYTPIHTSTVMMNRGIFEKVGYFNETLSVHEDSEFWNRVSDSFEFGYIAKPLGVYCWESNVEHITSGGNMKKFIDNGKRYLLLYEKNKGENITSEQKKSIIESQKIIDDIEAKQTEKF